MMCLNKKCGKISCMIIGYENYPELDILGYLTVLSVLVIKLSNGSYGTSVWLEVNKSNL